VDGVDEAAQLELYFVADRQPMQLDQGRCDMVGQLHSGHCSVDVGSAANTLLQ